MYQLANLAHGKTYLISGRQGLWNFSRRVGDRIIFYKFATTNRRITMKLSAEEAKNMVWEQVTRINFSQLEAFCGE